MRITRCRLPQSKRPAKPQLSSKDATAAKVFAARMATTLVGGVGLDAQMLLPRTMWGGRAEAKATARAQQDREGARAYVNVCMYM
ncbi:hypothetical protein OAO87_02110 [bacterium]|nr:hypothetical protein [bacterium]